MNVIERIELSKKTLSKMLSYRQKPVAKKIIGTVDRVKAGDLLNYLTKVAPKGEHE